MQAKIVEASGTKMKGVKSGGKTYVRIPDGKTVDQRAAESVKEIVSNLRKSWAKGRKRDSNHNPHR